MQAVEPGAQADGMSVGAIYMAKHRSGANDKNFVVGLVSLVSLR